MLVFFFIFFYASTYPHTHTHAHSISLFFLFRISLSSFFSFNDNNYEFLLRSWMSNLTLLGPHNFRHSMEQTSPLKCCPVVIPRENIPTLGWLFFDPFRDSIFSIIHLKIFLLSASFLGWRSSEATVNPDSYPVLRYFRGGQAQYKYKCVFIHSFISETNI